MLTPGFAASRTATSAATDDGAGSRHRVEFTGGPERNDLALTPETHSTSYALLAERASAGR